VILFPFKRALGARSAWSKPLPVFCGNGVQGAPFVFPSGDNFIYHRWGAVAVGVGQAGRVSGKVLAISHGLWYTGLTTEMTGHHLGPGPARGLFGSALPMGDAWSMGRDCQPELLTMRSGAEDIIVTL
jgi:hypothetical protein